MATKTVSELRHTCGLVKELLLGLHFRARSGHVGSALSCAEILSFIRFSCWSDSTQLVLSKGHAASALYSVLAVAGDIDIQNLTEGYYQNGTLFAAHPPPNKLPNIPFATGSLGHGPGLATGLAMGAKLQRSTQEKIFCVLSDGELNEGSCWEAFAFAAHHKLQNLVFVVDQNNIQGFGRTDDVITMRPLPDKFRSFGLAVIEADGHDFESLASSYKHVTEESRDIGAPALVIAKTIKGRGLRGLADTVDSHYLPMTPEVYAAAIDFCRREALSSMPQHHSGDEYAG